MNAVVIFNIITLEHTFTVAGAFVIHWFCPF